MKPFIFLTDCVRALVNEIITQEWGNTSPTFALEQKDQKGFGDYSINAPFVLAPQLKLAPAVIATRLQELLCTHTDMFERVEIAGTGFVNLFLAPEYVRAYFKELRTLDTSAYRTAHPEKVIVEFSSPNVAKPMHMGHLRNTILGDFLARLHSFVGHTVIRWNHLGDWGTQFGKLIVAYREGWTKREAVEAQPIDELVRIYIEFHERAKTDTSLEDRARAEFKKLEEGDAENMKLLEWFRAESLKEFEAMYEMLGITFGANDVIRGESAYASDTTSIISELAKKGLAQESEGALIIPFENEGLSPAMIRKSDGTTLYFTRELASLEYRIKEYKPDAILYVVGNEQSLHFKQFFAVAKKLGYEAVRLEHVSYGLVMTTEHKKLSTRSGVIATAKQAAETIVNQARRVVVEKQPDLSVDEQNTIARAVGVSALRYNMLRDSRMSDVVFDPEKALSLVGNSAPYLQYTYARLNKIVSKGGPGNSDHLESLQENDLVLIKKLAGFKDALDSSLSALSSHHLTTYLFALATAANAYYEQAGSIINEENEQVRMTRLALLSEITHTLELGFNLLGVEVLSSL